MYEIQGKYTSAKIFINVEDTGVTEQTLSVCNHPIFKDCKIRVMPDCHKGNGCTIGFTAEMPKGGEIIPNIIGVDQSCGMLAIKLADSETLNDFENLDKVIRKNIPSGVNGRKILSPIIPEDLTEKVSEIVKDILKEDPQPDLLKIGSLGSGNHFISIEKGVTGTYLIIHSGSRNFGHKLARHFQDISIEKNSYRDGDCELKQLSFLTGDDAKAYLNCAKVCAEYAHYNRKVMAHEILDNMNWDIDEQFETVHNYIGEDGIIRKGAISCKKDEKVLIPLNMADGSLIAIGLGNEDWNNSAPHGAGRLYSRLKAQEILDMDEYKKRMENIFSTCVSKGTLDESPMAYKDKNEIIDGIKPTAQIIDHLIPLYNFKVS